MASPLKSPYTSTSTSTVELVPYRDELPMTTPKLDDSTSPEPRSAGLMSDTDAARPPLVPPHLRFRSTVPLLPTPGTVSKRNPPYVRRRLIFDDGREFASSLRRNPLYSAFGSSPWALCCSASLGLH